MDQNLTFLVGWAKAEETGIGQKLKFAWEAKVKPGCQSKMWLSAPFDSYILGSVITCQRIKTQLLGTRQLTNRYWVDCRS